MVVLRKDKEGNIKRSFRAPKDDDWTLIKKEDGSRYRQDQDDCRRLYL